MRKRGASRPNRPEGGRDMNREREMVEKMAAAGWLTRQQAAKAMNRAATGNFDVAVDKAGIQSITLPRNGKGACRCRMFLATDVQKWVDNQAAKVEAKRAEMAARAKARAQGELPIQPAKAGNNASAAPAAALPDRLLSVAERQVWGAISELRRRIRALEGMIDGRKG